MNVVVSQLHKTWILDLDGTLCRHNGYLDKGDEILPGVSEFFSQIPKEDMIVLLTARKEEHKEETLLFLEQSGIRYDHVIFNVPQGERILINDGKPGGLKTAVALNKKRDAPLDIKVVIDERL